MCGQDKSQEEEILQLSEVNYEWPDRGKIICLCDNEKLSREEIMSGPHLHYQAQLRSLARSFLHLVNNTTSPCAHVKTW